MIRLLTILFVLALVLSVTMASYSGDGGWIHNWKDRPNRRLVSFDIDADGNLFDEDKAILVTMPADIAEVEIDEVRGGGSIAQQYSGSLLSLKVHKPSTKGVHTTVYVWY